MRIKKTNFFSRTNFLLLLILIYGLFLRLYLLEEIPGEIWGDIAVGFDYTKNVLKGRFPLDFILADGPLFFYIVAFFSLFFGLFFYTFKLTTVFLGMALILLVFLLVKEMLGEESIALLSSFLIAVSKWPLVYSRLGNLQIIVPVLVTLSFLFFFKSIKTEKTRYFIIFGFLAGLGMFAHPGFFTTPMAVGICYLHWFFQKRPDFFPTIKKLFIAFIVASIVFLPIGKQFIKQRNSLFSPKSYFGEKLFLPDGSIRADWFPRLLGNIKKAALAFHVKGDITFRENPPFDPHLDFLSGLFFLLGISWWLVKKQRLSSFYIFFPFFFLQLQMILVINHPISVPSAGRSIAIMPFVLILTATGIWLTYNHLKKIKRQVALLFLAAILLIISALNFEKYFFAYAAGLPNHNTPFGKIIAQKIDQLPQNTKVYVVNRHWGEWGQPEPKGIEYALKKKRKIIFMEKGEFSCQDFPNGQFPKYFVLNPNKEESLRKLKTCFPFGEKKTYLSRYQEPIFVSYWVK